MDSFTTFVLLNDSGAEQVDCLRCCAQKTTAMHSMEVWVTAFRCKLQIDCTRMLANISLPKAKSRGTIHAE
jgi:hypothetical protein